MCNLCPRPVLTLTISRVDGMLLRNRCRNTGQIRNCTIHTSQNICIRRKFQDNSVDKLLEFFRLISRVYSNESAHAEPASQATPILAVSATPADGLLSQATPPSATSAIVDSIPCRAITLRSDIGEVGTFDLQFDVCSDTEYDSYIMDTSANMFA